MILAKKLVYNAPLLIINLPIYLNSNLTYLQKLQRRKLKQKDQKLARKSR